MSANESIDETSFGNSEISLPRPVRFWLLLFSNIPSIICSFLLLYHLIHDRTLRQALNNHVIILLLILGLTTQLIEMPFYLAFIANSGIVKPSVPVTCVIWWFVSFGMYNAGTLLMAWTAIERHILIFNSQWLSTKHRRFFLHYLPIILILSYTSIFYTWVLLFFPCQNLHDYSLPICGAAPCYQANSTIGIWEFLVNNIIPSLLVALLSIALLIRVIRQKRRRNRQLQWRKQRKMTIQLVSLSALNVVFNIPLNIISLSRLCGLPDDYGVQIQHYFYFSCYFLIFFFPFVCLVSYPELVRKVKWKVLCRKIQSKPVSVSGFSIAARKN